MDGRRGPGTMRARQTPEVPDVYTPLDNDTKEKDVRGRPPTHLARGEYYILGLLVLVASCVRLYRLDRPSSVVFDEVHFGGFAAKYLHRTFFMDVHPPLAKLLITLAAYLGGFHGNFDFTEIGREYLVTPDMEAVPYVAMRLLCALFGLATVPLAYLTLRGLDLRPASAVLGALLVTFENALTTQSRFILLDAPLIFFMALALCAWVQFAKLDRYAPFSRAWWMALGTTGVALGAVVSCKWVGLFTIAAVGLAVVVQLWHLLGDVRIPLRTLWKHFVARAVCLILVPVLVYMLTFAIHFQVLSKAGKGDTFMSWPFRHTLEGNAVPDTYADVVLGSTIRLQHYNTVGGYLHSHAHSLQTGSRQQQVTLYPFIDANNEWIVLRAPGEDTLEKDESGHTITPDDEVMQYMHNLTYLEDGMRIRLLHGMTQLRLHSHSAHRPPVSESDYQNEVTAYGFPDQKFGGDVNDDWVVVIDHQEHTVPRHAENRVVALRTVFQLRHANLGCYLYSHSVSLPEWGFGQQEVTCNGNPTRPNTLWYVETNMHPELQNEAKPAMVNYVLPGFLSKFIELQKVMWRVNSRLTDRHVYESRPLSWPFLRRGINFWTKHHRQVYLFGNPLAWGAGTLSVLLYAGVRVLLVLRAQRGYRDFSQTSVVYYDQVCGFLALAWAMHYLPFWLMKRQLFVHHYLPALYISILLSAALFDMATGRLRPWMRMQAALVIAVVAALFFWQYSPMVYASRWTGEQCQRSIHVKTWDFNCVDFPASRAEYDAYDSVVNAPEGRRPWLTMPDLLHHKASPAPNPAQASVAEASGVHTHADESSVSYVPNLQGLDQAQRQQAILEGTQSLGSLRTEAASSAAPK